MDISPETQKALDHLTGHGWAIVGYNAEPSKQDVEGAIATLLGLGYHVDPPGVVRVQADAASAITIPVNLNLGSGSFRFFEYLRKMWQIHLAKNAGYSGFQFDRINDSFANFREAEDLGSDAFTGCLIRAGDKWNRIKSLKKNPSNEQVGESLEDTMLDLANYMVIALCLRGEMAQQAEVKAEWEAAVANAADSAKGYGDGIVFKGTTINYGTKDAYNTIISKPKEQ